MDVDLLRSLVAVVDAGTITEGATRLHISQSALSRRLQQLETELGATLLARGRHGIEVTTAGRLAVDEGRVLLARYDRLRDDLAAELALDRGTVSVGGGATATTYLLPAAIAAFGRRHPAIRFQVREAASHDIALAVAAGEIDLGLVTVPVPRRGLQLDRLVRDEITLVARADHPLVGRRRVRPADLAGRPVVAFEPGSAIRAVIDGALRAAGAEIDVVMELRSIPSMLRMVSTTGYLAFVSRLSLVDHPELVAVPVAGIAIARTIALARREHRPLPPASAAFAGQLLESPH